MWAGGGVSRADGCGADAGESELAEPDDSGRGARCAGNGCDGRGDGVALHKPEAPARNAGRQSAMSSSGARVRATAAKPVAVVIMMIVMISPRVRMRRGGQLPARRQEMKVAATRTRVLPPKARPNCVGPMPMFSW